MVIRPVLFRPPLLDRPSVRVLTGRPFHSSERSIRTSPRWPGVVGLYVFNAMSCCLPLVVAPRGALFSLVSEPGGHVDGVTLDERHIGLLHVAPAAGATLELLHLA